MNITYYRYDHDKIVLCISVGTFKIEGWTEVRTVQLCEAGASCTCPVFRESCQICHHMFVSFRWLLNHHSFFAMATRRSNLQLLGAKLQVLVRMLRSTRWWLTRNASPVGAATLSPDELAEQIRERYEAWKVDMAQTMEQERLKQVQADLEASTLEKRAANRKRMVPRPARFADGAE